MKNAIIALLLGIICLTPLSAYEISQKKAFDINEDEVIDFTESYLFVTRTGGKAVIFVEIENEAARGTYCWIDGRRLGPYDNVIPGQIGDSFAIPGQGFIASSEGQYSVILHSGEEFGPYFAVMDLEISKNGKQWGAIIEDEENGENTVVINGKELKNFKGFIEDFTLSRNGDSWGFVYAPGNPKLKYVVINNKKVGPYNDVSVPVFSQDGKKHCYVIGGAKKTGRVVLNGKVIANVLDPDTPSLSFDGSSWGVSVGIKKSSLRTMIINGKGYGAFVECDDLRFSKNGNSWAYLGYDKKQLITVMLNNKAYGKYKKVDSVCFSDDGKSWGFSAVKSMPGNIAASVVVVNGKEYGSYSAISSFTLSPDGSTWAAITPLEDSDAQEESMYRLILDGKPADIYDPFGLKLLEEQGEYYFHWFTLKKQTINSSYMKVK